MTSVTGQLHLRLTGKRLDDGDIVSPIRVSITASNGDVFRWTECGVAPQEDGTLVILLPDMEPVR